MERNCIFCKILEKEIPAKFIAENEFAISFMDINPASEGHVIVIPKKHFENYEDCDSKYLVATTLLAKEICKKIKNSPLKPKGFNFLSNQNKIAGQEIFHFHMHVIPKYEEDQGLIMRFKNENKVDVEKTFNTIKKSKYTIV